MKDERIQTTTDHYAAIGFFIWQFLLSLSLWYRMTILKQSPREWWDIGAILFFGIFLIFFKNASNGVFDHDFRKKFLTICIGLIIIIPAVLFAMGAIQSLVDLGGLMIGCILGLGVLIGVTYVLNQRWKKKAGIEDEN